MDLVTPFYFHSSSLYLYSMHTFLQVTPSMKKIQFYVVLYAACIAVYTTIAIVQDAPERLAFAV